MRHISALLLCVATLALLPRATYAQDEEPPIYEGTDCNILAGTSGGCSGSGYHITTGGGIAGGTMHPQGDCYYCTTGDFSDCHGVCSANMDEHTKAAYLKAVNAGRLGDALKVVSLGRDLPGLVVYNRARAAVEIRACDRKNILANLPLTAAEERVADRVLRDAGKRVATSQ